MSSGRKQKQNLSISITHNTLNPAAPFLKLVVRIFPIFSLDQQNMTTNGKCQSEQVMYRLRSYLGYVQTVPMDSTLTVLLQASYLLTSQHVFFLSLKVISFECSISNLPEIYDFCKGKGLERVIFAHKHTS